MLFVIHYNIALKSTTLMVSILLNTMSIFQLLSHLQTEESYLLYELSRCWFKGTSNSVYSKFNHYDLLQTHLFSMVCLSITDVAFQSSVEISNERLL